MKNIFLIVIISFLTTANQCGKQTKKALLPSDNNINMKFLLNVGLEEKVLLSATLDTVAKWEYIQGSKTEENRVYPYHFYSDMVGGGTYCFQHPSLRSDSINLTFLCVLPYIKRSPELIDTLYNTYKEMFFELVDTSKARKLGLDIMANDLLFTYDTLFRRKTPEKVFREYIKKGGGFDYDMMFIHREGNTKYYRSFITYQEWVYSFWYRRHLEGNLEVCLKILKEVSKRYPAKKETTLRYKEDERKKEMKTRKKKILTHEETKNNEAIKKILDKIEIFK